MAKEYKDVQSAVPTLPERVCTGNSIRIRTNIRRIDVPAMMEGQEPEKIWQYDETVYTVDEYIQNVAQQTAENNAILNTILGVNE